MASLYRRARSPFHWCSYIDPATGRRLQRSTKLRLDSVDQTRKARDLCREITQAEGRTPEYQEVWEAWVPRFLNQRYHGLTLVRYTTEWRNISAYLAEHRIDTPRQLSRSAARGYIEWRAVEHEATFAGCKNTALLELKLLALIMREAAHNGFVSGPNPCERLGIGRDAAPRKPRISEIEHRHILQELASRPEWMRVCYAIAWEQGCRLSETHLHIGTQIDTDRAIIRFRTKGHKGSLAEFPLAPQLLPMFAQMIAEGREWSCILPRNAARAWWDFFRAIGLPHVCFHCTRITWITRAYEAGIPREHIMRMCGHATYAAHQIYPRIEAGGDQLQELMRRVSSSSPVSGPSVGYVATHENNEPPQHYTPS
jgi:integrase